MRLRSTPTAEPRLDIPPTKPIVMFGHHRTNIMPLNKQNEKYFNDLEDMIVKRLHAQSSSDRGRMELAESTGIKDQTLIKELCQLGVTADGLIALRLFPLVLVAWAEERVDEAERVAVMAEATRMGIEEDSVAWLILDSWLRRSPPGIGVDAWRRYTHELLGSLTRASKQRLIELTHQQMIAVAKASGGHFGFGKIGKKEQLMIDQIGVSMRREII